MNENKKRFTLKCEMNYPVEKELTKLFTSALKAEGFIFPARSVNGKFTILKPFDEGAFIVDAKYQVFHLKRQNQNQ